MHLAELISLRTRPGAGVLLALTQRCPLSCAHCSTHSTLSAMHFADAPFRKLVESFDGTYHPDVMFMSGGEPLLRPELVAHLASRARSAGTRSGLLSGMFFARQDRAPASIMRAIGQLDHFSASVDAYHEREVSRDRVFAALRVVIERVPAVSLHVTGHGCDDGYVVDLLAQVRRTFGERMPVLVSVIQPTGRARSFVADRRDPAGAGPCEFAAWPLVDYDGTVFACSRQSLVRRHRPGHLVLGHAARDTWATLCARSRSDPVLRAVRTAGPVDTARRSGGRVCGSDCETCVRLGAAEAPSPGVETLAQRLIGGLRPQDLARRWGAGRHCDLVELGWRPDGHPR